MNYQRLWKEHKQWIENGIKYYSGLLEAFDQASGTEYDKVANQLATFEFQLDCLERQELTEAKKYIRVEENVG